MALLTILGLETSCDETAAAVVRLGEDGRPQVLSSVVASQVDEHAPFGGVVPELAARAHVEVIDKVAERAMAEARVGYGDLSGVAATAGPGLVGGVMVGLSFAKAVAVARGLPLIAVNHLEGHALSARLAGEANYPFLLLLVSGGHCQLLTVEGVGRYQRLGSTIDDAAGEAFDKIAKALGLGYPGGPALEALAERGDASRYDLPRALLGRKDCDFSFSGLKTAAARLAEGVTDDQDRADLAAAVQGCHRAPACRTLRSRARGIRQGPRPSPVRGRRRRRGQPHRAQDAGSRGRRARVRIPRAAAGLLHRQRRDDRAGGRGAAGAGPDLVPRCGGATALAAGRGRGAGQPNPQARSEGSQGVNEYRTAGVIGGGAWGTALALVCARAGLKTTLWAREPEVVEQIRTERENTPFLPGFTLFDVEATGDLADLADSDLILAVPPAQHMRATLEAFKPHARPGLPIVLCAKGVERGTNALMTRVLKETLPSAAPAVLSGPSFAKEVAQGLPAAVTLASNNAQLALDLAEVLATPTFRPYVADDMIGAEAGGALKNVLAIACGISEGKGLGKSAHAALITRGFAEMTRYAVAVGAKPETLAGLCGLGDLVLTCSSPQSRNMSVGLALGQGQSLKQALAGKLSVAEGVESAPAVVELAEQLGVETPICAAVAAILKGKLDVDEALFALMTRPLKSER